MRLRDGAEHQTASGDPQKYNVSTFSSTDLPLTLNQQSDVHLGRLDTAIYALPMRALEQRITWPGRQTLPPRVAFALLLSCGLPGADACGCPAGGGFAPRRKEFRFRLHPAACHPLLRALLHRNRPGAAEQASRISGSVAGQPSLRCRRHLSAVADGHRRPRAKRDCRLGLAHAFPSVQRQDIMGRHFSGLLEPAAAALGSQRLPWRLSSHPRRLRDPRISYHVLPGPGRVS